MTRPALEPLVVAGTYDREKHRARILLAGMRSNGVAVHEVNVPAWTGVRDKGTLSRIQQLAAACRLAIAWPRLIRGYMRAPRHKVLLVPYPGVFEVLLLSPFAKLRGARIAWDLFISPWDTIVHDRRSHAWWHPLPLLLYAAEWIAARVATWLFLDTDAHARRIERTLALSPGRIGCVPLGTDPVQFPPRPDPPLMAAPLRVLFYGQYIPLHGLETIVEAAHLLELRGVPVKWLLAGAGQEEPRVTAMIVHRGVNTVEQVGWVPLDRLPALINGSDVGLGIFGITEKAHTVIPNKVYELAATQTPIVTGDTPALREFAPGHPWVIRTKPGDATALADAVERLATGGPLPPAPRLPIVGPMEVGAAFLSLLESETSM
jgi:glycosyltransferase involved in cell wall biosynthesis